MISGMFPAPFKPDENLFQPNTQRHREKTKVTDRKAKIFRMLSEKPSDLCSNSFAAH